MWYNTKLSGMQNKQNGVIGSILMYSFPISYSEHMEMCIAALLVTSFY